jgi:hypothetical protein
MSRFHGLHLLLGGTALVSGTLLGCAQPVSPVFTSTEPRIWVVRGSTEVYRCVDMAPEGKGPQPICVQAERVTKGE